MANGWTKPGRSSRKPRAPNGGSMPSACCAPGAGAPTAGWRSCACPAFTPPSACRCARLRQGTPALIEGDDVYTNHIHADDLARLIAAALFQGLPGRVYHAVDDSEMKMAAYFDAVAEAFGLPRPPRLPRAALGAGGDAGAVVVHVGIAAPVEPPHQAGMGLSPGLSGGAGGAGADGGHRLACNSVSKSFVKAKAKRRQYACTASEADKVHG